MKVSRLAILLLMFTWSPSGCSKGEAPAPTARASATPVNVPAVNPADTPTAKPAATPADGTAVKPAASAKQSYQLKGSEPPKGRSYINDEKINITNGKLAITADGNSITRKMSATSRSLERIDILETNNGRVTKVKVEHLYDETKTVMTLDGDVHKETESEPLAGKSFFGTKSGGLWKFRLEGGEPDPKQLKALEEYARTFDDILQASEYPTESMRIGKSWDLPPGYLARMLGPEFINPSGTGVSTLKEVITRDGRSLGLINSVMNMKGTMIDPDDGSESSMELSLQGHHYRDLKHFIDLDLKYKGTFRIAGTSVEDGTTTHKEFSGPIVMTGGTKVR